MGGRLGGGVGGRTVFTMVFLATFWKGSLSSSRAEYRFWLCRRRRFMLGPTRWPAAALGLHGGHG